MTGFQRRAAALLRSAANDLKRNEADAASDLGLPEEQYRGYLSGTQALSWELIQRAAQVWPLNERDLLPLHDDVPLGVRVVGRAESAASSRVIRRGGVDYYEYRDTAMSRVASFRPEYIKMLQSVSDDDPHNPAVQWNEGHLLYQFTYFVGPVNYYYSWRGQARCAEMETGDSVWGLPFAPHSFTARDPHGDAHILALTYGGQLVGDTQRELAVLGARTTSALALPVSSAAEAGAATLRSLLRARLLSQADIAAAAEMPPERVARLCSGADTPTQTELTALAAALRVAERDLLPRTTAATDGVTIQRHATARRWVLLDGDRPVYEVVRLAGDPLHPDTTAFEVTTVGDGPADPDLLRTHQHTYLYMLRAGTADLVWEHAGPPRARRVQPGDSVYALPGVGLGLTARDGRPATALLLRIGSTVDADVRYALGGFIEHQVDRYLCEDRQWYRTAGRSAAARE